MQTMELSKIQKNLEYIEDEIENTRQKSSYKQEVKLVAVSKAKPEENILEAYNAGIRDFGENKVQELLTKYENLPKDVRWHFIGHLQTNKVKYIVDKVYLIHSVDSIKLANEIEKEATRKDVICNVLIQVNISGEKSKFGIQKEDANELIRQVAKLPHINIKGLMTIAPKGEEENRVREIFKGLKQLCTDADYFKQNNQKNCELSMGMSGDFKPAIIEGATYVRIGTAIFGKRN